MTFEVGVLWAGVVALALASLLGWVSLIFQARWAKRGILWGTLLAVAFLGVSVGHRWWRVGHGPYINALEVLSSSVLLGALVLAWLFWRRPILRAAAGPLLGLSVLLLGWGVLSSAKVQPLPATFESVWLFIHIGFAKVAYGSVLGASAVAFVYLWRTRGERVIEEGSSLDSLAYRLIAFGFVAMSFMIAAGALWAQNAWGRYWDWDPIETWALATWIAYGLYLHARITWRVKGRPSAWAVLFLLGLSILAFFVIARVATTVHTEFMVS